jgi:DNA-binding NarL/FixJ family response regulator
MQIRIVDDHPLYIRRTGVLLEELAPEVAIDTAGTIEASLWLISQGCPDLILLDLKVPAVDLTGVARVRKANGAVPVVIVSGTESREHAWRPVEIGAAGFIPEVTEPSRMRVAARRRVFARPGHARGDLRLPRRRPCAVRSPQAHAPPTHRPALPVARKIQQVIGPGLSIGESTVRNHLLSTYQVLGVSSRLQVIAKALELCLIEGFKSLRPAM